MNIPTKYNINQKLYYVVRQDRQILQECPACKGTKKIDVPEYGMSKCPKCEIRNDGMIVEKIVSTWGVGGHIVPNCITIQVLESPDYFENIRVTINYSDLGGHGEHHLFPTKQEAKAWCEEANKEPMKDGLWHNKGTFYKLEELKQEIPNVLQEL